MRSNRRHFIKGALGVFPAMAISGTSLSEGVKILGDSKAERKKETPLVNCYYYAPHNHSMLDRHIAYDLEKMVSIGTDIVSFCLQEEQMTNWHQQRVHNFIDAAHGFGLDVHVIPNRWCGLLAGWLDGFSNWTIRNTDVLYPGYDWGAFADVTHEKVISHYKENIKRLLTDFQVEGIIWDEPRPADKKEVFTFLDEMSAYAKSLKSDLITSIFAESSKLHLVDWFIEFDHIDYLGSDGHVRSEDHQMHRMKTTIFKAHERFYPRLKAAGKKTFFLLEGQRHRDEDLGNYLQNLERAFTLPMDHLMFYYCAHEMTPSKARVMTEETWKMIAQLKKR